MGYTHYWHYTTQTGKQQQARDKKWPILQGYLLVLMEVAEERGVPLAYESDEPGQPPFVGETFVRFNGVGDEGHETFIFHRTPPHSYFETYIVRDLDGKEETRGGEGFAFCKTARKPYDACVCAALVIAKDLGMIGHLGSDGDPQGTWWNGKHWPSEEWDQVVPLLQAIRYRRAKKEVLIKDRSKGGIGWTTPERLAALRDLMQAELV